MYKRTRSLFLFTVMLLLVGFASCKKDDNNDTPSGGESYGPTVAGSTWTYVNADGSSAFTYTATNRDTVAMGRTYDILTSTSGGNIYQAQDGNDYYRFGSFSDLGISAVEELYLRQHLNIGDGWTINVPFTYMGFPLTANLFYTIKSKNQSRKVRSNNFENVVNVGLDLKISGASIGTGDFFYARGIGLIESDLNVSIPGQGTQDEHTLLESYNIK